MKDLTLQDVYEAVKYLQGATELRFDKIEGRFDKLEGRFDKLEVRVQGLETTVDGMERRLFRLETRVDDGFNAINSRLDRLEARRAR